MRLTMPVYGKNAKRELTTEFRGYNCTDSGGEGSGGSTFSDMINGGTDKYPFAASRPPRRKTQYDEATCALSGGEVLTRVQPPYLIYGDEEIDIGLSAGEKQIVKAGTAIYVFPDAKYYDTKTGKNGELDEGVEYTQTSGDGISEMHCKGGEGVYVNSSPLLSGLVSTFEVEYTNSVSGYIRTSIKGIWTSKLLHELSTSVTNYGSIENMVLAYVDGEFYYVKKCTWRDVNANVSYVAMSKIVWERLDVDYLKLSLDNDELGDMGNLWCGDEHVYLDGNELHLCPGQDYRDILKAVNYNSASEKMRITFTWKTRTFPILDHVFVHNHRLFGCRFGIPYNEHTARSVLYVSALDNYKEFEQFKAISTDSWFSEVSEEGPFTAACTYNGYPMFFKEDYLYILYGDYPPYTYSPIKLRGVADGAAKSLVEINGALFYKSRYDIMRYTGSSLNSISEALGDISGVAHAVGGVYRDSYHISLDGTRYVYDTANGLWSKEDVLPVIDFATVRGETHFLTEGGAVYTVSGGEESVPWSLTSPPIGYAYPNRKRLSSLQIRIEIGEGDELPLVELSFDGGEFSECPVRVNFIDGEGRRTGTIFIPVLPGRCELFRYRISGNGTYKLTGVTKIFKESGR